MVKSILLCFAHPDDEMSCAPLARRYMDAGARVTLLCATNGDVGTVDEEHLRGFDSIAALRLAEFACATDAVGYSEVVAWGYRDSGMMGAADNDHPESFWQAPMEDVTRRVLELMRRIKPQVVITFNTFGAYGHPDHIKIHRATVTAFERLQSEPEHPQKLYYMTIPRAFLRLSLAVMRLRRQDPRKSGRNQDMDMQAAYEASNPPTARVAVGPYLPLFWKVMRCYASQIELPPLVMRFGPAASRVFLRDVTLARAYPPVGAGERTERDLFAGVATSDA